MNILVVTAQQLQASLPMCSHVVAKVSLQPRIRQCFELLPIQLIDGHRGHRSIWDIWDPVESGCEQQHHSSPCHSMEKMVCHGLPQEVWTYDGSRWTKKATLATSGNDNIQGRVGVGDERPDDGLHETTRNNERPTWTRCRWLQNNCSVDPICDLTVPVLRLSNILRCRKETKLSPSTYMIYIYMYIYIYTV